MNMEQDIKHHDRKNCFPYWIGVIVFQMRMMPFLTMDAAKAGLWYHSWIMVFVM